MTHRTDSDLIEAAAAGDPAAFGVLYERYAPMIHGVLLARLNPADADEQTQEVFLTAMDKLAQLRDPDRLGPWLATIARNRALDLIRRRPRFAELTERTIARRDPARSEAEAVLRAIRELPDTYIEPLILRLVEGMTGPEIAERTGLTAGSVRVNLHRGMKLLREKLGLETAGAA